MFFIELQDFLSLKQFMHAVEEFVFHFYVSKTGIASYPNKNGIKNCKEKNISKDSFIILINSRILQISERE